MTPLKLETLALTAQNSDLSVYFSEEFEEKTELYHLWSSACKVFSTDLGHTALDESRRACGGLGYLFGTKFSELQGASDINRTWEGDNNVLIQQTAKILLKSYKKTLTGQTPIKSCEFITSTAPTQPSHFNTINELFRYKANYLVHQAATSMMNNMDDIEKCWNTLLPYHLKPMCEAYWHLISLESFEAFVDGMTENEFNQRYMKNLFELH